MKKLNFFFFLFFAVLTAMSQVPSRLNFQAIATDNNGQAIANTSINVRVSIYGPSVLFYREERIIQTDANGLFSFQIGSPGAVNIQGSLNSVNWKLGVASYTISIDPTGGTNWVTLPNEQFTTTPFSFQSQYCTEAIHADTASYALKSDSLVFPFYQSYNSVAGSHAFSINCSNSLGGAALHGMSSGTHVNSVGVLGETSIFFNGGVGVRGKSSGSNAIGMEGIANSGIAIKGKATSSGTAVLAENTSTGLALDVNGKLRIAGGNTNPVNNAVLTSDANGNAVWKKNKIGFIAYLPSTQSIPYNSYIVPNMVENYDPTNSFNTSAAATDPNTFIAPVSGFYSFRVWARVTLSSLVYDMNSMGVRIMVNGTNPNLSYQNDDENSTGMELSYSEDFHLNAGDKVKIELAQHNWGSLSASLLGVKFSGNLVFED